MKILSRIFIAFSWAGAIFILLASPMPEYHGTQVSYYDKVVHAFLFGVFSYLLIRVFVCQKNYKLWLAISFASLISFLYAFFGEYLQNYIPGRTASVWDLAAGVAGIILTQIFVYVGYKKR